MNEEPVSERPNGQDWMGYALAAGVLLVLMFTLTTGADREAADTVDGDFTLRSAQLMRAVGDVRPGRYDDTVATAFAAYRQANEAAPSPELIRRMGVVAAELTRPAMPIFQQLTSREVFEGRTQAEREALRRELALWRDIYGIVQVPREAIPEYEQQIRDLDLGPAEVYARRQMYVAAGEPERAEAVLRETLSSIAARLLPVAGVWFLFLVVGVPILLGFIWNRRRHLQRMEEEPPGIMPSPAVLWSSFLVFLVLFVLLQLIAAFLALQQDLTYRIVVTFGSYVLAGLLGLVWLSIKLQREGSSAGVIGLTTRDLGRNILLGFSGYAAILPLVFLTLVLIQLIERLFPNLPSPTHPAGPLIAQTAGQPVILLLFVLVAVMAPIIEETFFRGVLYYGLRVRLGAVAAILLSGAVFAAIHPQLPLGFLPLFVLGSGFAVLLAISKSLIPAMVAHGINNTLTFFLALFMLAD